MAQQSPDLNNNSQSEFECFCKDETDIENIAELDPEKKKLYNMSFFSPLKLLFHTL